ncbi:MAG: FISUMP domain-containing protein [Bacteroidales bacterium]
MKKSGILLIILCALAGAFSCQKDNDDNGDTNQPPGIPSNPTPKDGSTGQSLSFTASWTCTDPNQDPLTYDVYLGISDPPALVQEHSITNTYDVSNLQLNTTYYWKIVARDDKDLTTEGPVWEFTTSPGFQCGNDVTDPRDGQTYSTQLFGNACWMTENLNFGDRIPASQEPSNNSQAEKYCYNDNETNCDTYGALYRWQEFMNYGNGEDLCPAGWHAATFDEWKNLEISLGMDPAEAAQETGWVGTDQGQQMQNPNGFNILMGGYINSAGLSVGLSSTIRLWTSTEENSFNAFSRELTSGTSQVRHDKWSKEYGFYVRCVKN